jgi:hypothetical protein
LHSGAFADRLDYAAETAADLDFDSCFLSAYPKKIFGTGGALGCCDFKDRRIVPTHYTNDDDLGGDHLKSWLVETSVDGENWREVAREEDNEQLNGVWFSGTFAVAGGGECRFIQLVNIGRNHCGRDSLWIAAWEVFGGLVE